MLSISVHLDTLYRCDRCGFEMRSDLTLKGKPYYDEQQCPECWRTFLAQHIGLFAVVQDEAEAPTP